MSVKVLHIADLHLDTPFKSLKRLSETIFQQIQNATRTSLERLIDRAITEKVDAVLIVGDAFNSVQPDVREQMFLHQQLSRLIEANISVVLSFGNHDYYTGPLLIDVPKGVHVLNEKVSSVELTTQSNETLVVSGFSYYRNHIEQVEWQAFPHKKAHTYHIGMLHGQMGEGGYAPFTIQKLAEFGYDYWALGHIHQRGIISERPLVAYSGNIQGLHSNEVGDKGGYLVHLNPHAQVHLEKVDTAPIVWIKERIELSSDRTFMNVLEQIEALYKTHQDSNAQKETSLFLVKLDIYYDENVSKNVLEQLQDDAILEVGSKGLYQLVNIKLIPQVKKASVLLNDDMSTLWETVQESVLFEEMSESMKKLVKNKWIQQYFKEQIENPAFFDAVHQSSVQLVNEMLGGEANED
ncbi:DNA repair exonuclease [Carnobacteriaceae bacterium zg-ZUI240]|nr:DNA repair exonuclease [Carnobacteriaceae bacterium zg-ZUI240]